MCRILALKERGRSRWRCNTPAGPVPRADQLAPIDKLDGLVVRKCDGVRRVAAACNEDRGVRFFADQAFITRVNAAGGNAQMLFPPDLGIHGNSHMFMLDKNNLQIADLVLIWIDENVSDNQTERR